MNRTFPGLVVLVAVLSANLARADDFDDDYRGGVQLHVSHAGGCGPRPEAAPWGQPAAQGRYELQNVQTWVAGQQQQVWVPGQCRQTRHGQRCSQGSYRTQWTAGRYETRQEWVWVATGYDQQRGPHRRGRGQGRGSFHASSPAGTFSIAVH